MSVTLALRRITEAHTYDVLAKFLEKIHTKFGLIPGKNLTETITDSGSNFVKAFKVFGKKYGTELNRGTETDA